jgi:hypothetical protein
MRRLGQIAIFDQRRGGVIALEQRQQMEDRAHLAVRQIGVAVKSQAARASTSFIVREISRASFSNLPILIWTPCRVSPHG